KVSARSACSSLTVFVKRKFIRTRCRSRPSADDEEVWGNFLGGRQHHVPDRGWFLKHREQTRRPCTDVGGSPTRPGQPETVVAIGAGQRRRSRRGLPMLLPGRTIERSDADITQHRMSPV